MPREVVEELGAVFSERLIKLIECEDDPVLKNTSLRIPRSR